MLRQVPIVQQAFLAEIDDPSLTLRDTPTPHTLDVKFPPSPHVSFFRCKIAVTPQFQCHKAVHNWQRV
jgi:hypothetical protein